jgi:hypothetical protein
MSDLFIKASDYIMVMRLLGIKPESYSAPLRIQASWVDLTGLR